MNDIKLSGNNTYNSLLNLKMSSIYGYQPTDGYHQASYRAAPAPAPACQMDYYQSGYNSQCAVVAAAAPQQSYQPVYAPALHCPVAAPAYNAGYNARYNASGYYVLPQPFQQAHQVQEQPQVEEQPVTGGVSAVLDYDLKIMSKFTTYLAFKLFGRSDTDNSEFIKNLNQILSSVRLPMSSLILSNYFLLSRYQKSTEAFLNNTDENIRENLILALILANKANDDSTFINKSWSDATGLNVKLINSLEAQWLSLFEWRLHNMDMEKYNELHLQFIKYAENVKLQEEQKKQEHQLQSSYLYPQHKHYEPVSPVLSDQSDFSTIDHQNNWYRQNVYNYQSAGFEQPSCNIHCKNYSFQMEPEYCSRTGSYYKMMYCSCHYYSSPPRLVDSSYSMATAAY